MAQFYCKSSFFGQSYLWSVFCFNDRQRLALNVNFKPCHLILWEYQPGKIWLLRSDNISISKVLKRVTMIKVCFLGEIKWSRVDFIFSQNGHTLPGCHFKLHWTLNTFIGNLKTQVVSLLEFGPKSKKRSSFVKDFSFITSQRSDI